MSADHYSDSYTAAVRYCHEVQDGILASIRADLGADFFKEPSDLSDRLHEEIDGCETVIYTGRSWVYLTGSRNDEAYKEESADGTDIDLAQRCYYAIRADVEERIEWENMLHAVENGLVAEYLGGQVKRWSSHEGLQEHEREVKDYSPYGQLEEATA